MRAFGIATTIAVAPTSTALAKGDDADDDQRVCSRDDRGGCILDSLERVPALSLVIDGLAQQRGHHIAAGRLALMVVLIATVLVLFVQDTVIIT